MSRIIVLGIDGADWQLVTKWHKEHLPAFNRLMNQGAYGALKSIVPPTTCPAWWSWATGKDPGTLGIFDFANKVPDQYKLQFTDSTHFADQPIWEILGIHGKKTAVINMPVTYPPEPLNGIMITGIMTKDITSEFTYPPSLKNDLLSKFPNYQFDINRSQMTRNAAAKAQNNITKIQQETIKWMWQEDAYDLFLAVLMATDRVQHLYWREQQPNIDKPDGKTILDTYKEMDQWLAHWLDTISSEDYLFVISDHGGQYGHGRFHLNEWLLANGYLYLQESPVSKKNPGWMQLLRNLLINSSAAPFLRRFLPRNLKKLGQYTINPSQVTNLESIIDFSRTKAYALSAGRLYINVAGKEPNGIVKPGKPYQELRDELIKKLSNLQLPCAKMQQSLHCQLHKKEELYTGRNIANAPDLNLSIEHRSWGIETRIGLQHDCYFTYTHNQINDIFGTHAMDGIFLAKGPQINPNSLLQDIRLIDVTPTLLHIFGLPIPEDMDGEVKLEIFQANSEIRQKPIQKSSPAIRVNANQNEISEAVLNRLKGLGYLQ